jgi:hypothetical protein
MSETKNGPYQDVPSRESALPNTEPQAPRSIPLSEVGDDRAGNKPYNGDASSSRMRGRGGSCPVPPPVS